MTALPLRALAALALACAALACHAAGLGERDALVLEALINHGLAADTPIVVIAKTTTGDPAAIATHTAEATHVIDELGVPPATLADWVRRNAQRVAIDRALRLGATYQLLEEDDRAKLFAAPDPQLAWGHFFARYEGAPGLLRLSRPGYDETFDHALVYIEHHCGVACGAGRLVHLARGADGQWQVKGAAFVWMADDVPVPPTASDAADAADAAREGHDHE